MLVWCTNVQEIAPPAKTIELKNKRDDMHYKLEIYTDGNKHEKGVGSGVAIFVDGSLTHQ